MSLKRQMNNCQLLDALDCVDERYVAELVTSMKLPEDKTADPNAKKNWFRSFRYAATVAACALLLSAIIPVVGMIVGRVAIGTSGPNPAGNPSAESLETEAPETESPVLDEETNVLTVIYDGSEGLEYRMNPDGQSASFIGFGTCTDEHIVIASTYNGVPVTEMINDKYLSGVPAQEAGNIYAKSITISDSVESISNGIFEFCPNLESFYIGANVNFIRPFVANIMEGYNLSEIKVSPQNSYFSDNGNCLIEKQSKTLIVSCKNSVIPSDGSVEIIGSMAFSLYPNNSIVIPEGVKRIELMAFSDSKLESVVFPMSLSFLGAHVFENCKNLKFADLNGFSELPQGTFHNCDNLSKIIGIEKVTFIGGLALSSCEALTEINLGVGLTEIGDQAFYSNLNMKTINYAGTVEQWYAIKKGAGWNTLMKDQDWHEKIPVGLINCSDGTTKP